MLRLNKFEFMAWWSETTYKGASLSCQLAVARVAMTTDLLWSIAFNSKNFFTANLFFFRFYRFFGRKKMKFVTSSNHVIKFASNELQESFGKSCKGRLRDQQTILTSRKNLSSIVKSKRGKRKKQDLKVPAGW